MQILIKRIAEYKGATLGVVLIDKRPQFVSLELPWLNNEQNKSCIPEGYYDIRIKRSDKFGVTLEVQGVPNRSDILFHAGNTAKDTHGCILLGRRFGEIEGLPAVLDSNMAIKDFRYMILNEDETGLIIINNL